MGTWRSLAFYSLAACAAAQSTSTAGAYGQCGGSGYVGPTACVSGYFCTSYNDYYYQCIPGATTTTSPTRTSSLPTSTPASTTSSSTTTSSKPASSSPSTTTAPATSSSSSSSASGSGTPTTLVSGWYWIRAVETPYYHSYLQAQPTATPGADAVMGDASSAGQFNVVDGQLVYDTSSGSGGGGGGGGGGGQQQLYMWVEDPADKTQRALATWFDAAANPYGTFGLAGDTVTWADPDVSRGNTAAFYVCPAGGENSLFVNTGAYGYETPSGCYDVDIHTYGGSTADV